MVVGLGVAVQVVVEVVLRSTVRLGSPPPKDPLVSVGTGSPS